MIDDERRMRIENETVKGLSELCKRYENCLTGDF